MCRRKWKLSSMLLCGTSPTCKNPIQHTTALTGPDQKCRTTAWAGLAYFLSQLEPDSPPALAKVQSSRCHRSIPPPSSRLVTTAPPVRPKPCTQASRPRGAMRATGRGRDRSWGPVARAICQAASRRGRRAWRDRVEKNAQADARFLPWLGGVVTPEVRQVRREKRESWSGSLSIMDWTGLLRIRCMSSTRREDAGRPSQGMVG
ncbi:hypothetical protein B0T11DRAFT_280279 [Plectosphaerella cucumerina]|uniref:Uncharacterized protein n=1 Tax=Plectosphaerella cucumerina TaxID=40658 RepID=A0A8K0X488_9PEZI|nr:hypothetical protein B0T11DRAFT_280279 [Plectosphaerella cucumerina]